MSQRTGSQLALISAPSTPASKLTLTATPTQTPSPGTWRHPKFDEIARRQKASTFDVSNVHRILFNILALACTWALGWAADYGYELILGSSMDGLTLDSPNVKTLIVRPVGDYYASWIVLLVRLALAYNIYSALRPLYGPQDTISDIPLTPTQRSLLGLDPKVSSSVPTLPSGAGPIITPPRYRRSITPRSGASNSRSPASGSASPLARKASGSLMRPNDSPSPSSPSTLWRKSLAGSTRDVSRRHSYGSPSPLGPGTAGKDLSMMGIPATPSPTTGRGASVTLNNKWLYEKGRASSGRSIFS